MLTEKKIKIKRGLIIVKNGQQNPSPKENGGREKEGRKSEKEKKCSGIGEMGEARD